MITSVIVIILCLTCISLMMQRLHCASSTLRRTPFRLGETALPSVVNARQTEPVSTTANGVKSMNSRNQVQLEWRGISAPLQAHIEASVPLPFLIARLQQSQKGACRFLIEESDGTLPSTPNSLSFGFLSFNGEAQFTITSLPTNGCPTKSLPESGLSAAIRTILNT